MITAGGKTTAEVVWELKLDRDPERNFRLLFERYHAQIRRFFQRKGMLPEDARDLTQDVFFLVYKGLRQVREDTHFENWLFTIAMNVFRNAVERIRAKKRAARHVSLDEHASGAAAQDAPAPIVNVVDPRPKPFEALLEKEKLEKLREALSELPEQMRRCVQLRVAKDKPYQEIAAIMGISVNTVKAHLHQSKRVLKDKLTPYFGEAGIGAWEDP